MNITLSVEGTTTLVVSVKIQPFSVVSQLYPVLPSPGPNLQPQLVLTDSSLPIVVVDVNPVVHLYVYRGVSIGVFTINRTFRDELDGPWNKPLPLSLTKSRILKSTLTRGFLIKSNPTKVRMGK